MINPNNNDSTQYISSHSNITEDNSLNFNTSIQNQTPQFMRSLINNEQIEKEKEKEKENEDISIILPSMEGLLHFFCKNCNKVPSIQFLSFTKINYSCDCKECDRNQFQYLKDIKYDDLLDYGVNHYLYCNEHQSEYCYYCYTCSTNLCRKCLSESNKHVTHVFFLFDENFFEANKKIDDIQNILFKKQKAENNELLNLLNDIFQSEEFNDTIINKYVKPFFNIICNDFKFYPNYSHFEIINNFNCFLNRFISNKKNDNEIKELNLKIFFKVNNKTELNKYKNNCEQIISLCLNESNINNINEICELNLVNLKTLELRNNRINTIEPLLKAKFKDIEVLNLAVNNIDDTNIKYLYEMNFPNLLTLNLYYNCFNSINIFKIRNYNKNLSKLDTFYIGNNPFNINIKEIDIKNTSFDFSSLKKIGLTKKIFNDDSIMIIKCFVFTNLQTLYLSVNDISSLSFVDGLELPSITNFQIHTSLITDYYPLVKYKTLEKIVLNNNKISNIDKLEKFFEELQKLKILDLQGNNIDINNKENKEIIKRVRQKNINLITIKQD